VGGKVGIWGGVLSNPTAEGPSEIGTLNERLEAKMGTTREVGATEEVSEEGAKQGGSIG